MATLTVTTNTDTVNNGNGLLSLREAVAQANATAAADTIVFAASVERQTLVLTRGELAVTRDLTIDGDGNDNGVGVTLDGGGGSRILHVSGAATDAVLADLTFRNGAVGGVFSDESGGAILSEPDSISDKLIISSPACAAVA